jgi:Protein of unknown function with HXXEE motif
LRISNSQVQVDTDHGKDHFEKKLERQLRSPPTAVESYAGESGEHFSRSSR